MAKKDKSVSYGRSYGSSDGAGFQTVPGPRIRSLDKWERAEFERRAEKGDEEAKQELAADDRFKAEE